MQLEHVLMVCKSCSSKYAATEKLWRCRCGGFLDLHFQAFLEPEKIAGKAWNFWRYHAALPLGTSFPDVSMGEPCTPLVKKTIAGKKLLLKLENHNPTGSFKDRGSAMMINAARCRGIKNIVEDSSGNAGASVAAYAAAAGIEAEILVPGNTSEGKTNLISLFGANLVKVKGSRQETANEAIKRGCKTYYASHCWDPFFLEGVKTIAYEMAEQLAWKSPDNIYLPVGNGSLLLGVYRGFRQMLEWGLVDKMPVLRAVQSENCAPVYNYWNEKKEVEFCGTLAEGIAVENPPRLREIVDCVEESGGCFETVADWEIISALKLAAAEGILMEPTSGVALAAAIRSEMPQNETIVPITGSGLKMLSKLVDLIRE